MLAMNLLGSIIEYKLLNQSCPDSRALTSVSFLFRSQKAIDPEFTIYCCVMNNVENRIV